MVFLLRECAVHMVIILLACKIKKDPFLEVLYV